MKKNIGGRDRLIRLAISCALFIYSYLNGSWIALAFALFTLFEAAASWCVLYQVIGKSSCPIRRK